MPRGAVIHQLAQWISQAKRELELDSALEISQTCLRLAWLRHDIESLREAKVSGVEERVSRLVRGAEEQCFAAIHELRTAAIYLHSGHHIAFVAEGPETTPDLMLDGSIEVECKHKTRTTKKDRRRDELYQLLFRRVRAEVELSRSVDGIEMQIGVFCEPTPELIDRAVLSAKSLLRDQRQYMQWIVDPEWDCVLKRLAPMAFDSMQTVGSIINYISPFHDIAEYQMVNQRRVPERLEAEKITFFALKCHVEEDRVKSLRKSLTSAAGQLSGNRVGIVQLDVTSLAARLDPLQLKRARMLIEQALSNNTSVSAVRIAQEQITRDDTGWIIGTGIATIRNPSARHELEGEDARLTREAFGKTEVEKQ